MRRVTRLLLSLAFVASTVAPAYASAPSVADLDAHARAVGNRKELAVAVGDRVFTKTWPAQVMQVAANEYAGHLVLGMRVSGVHFHGDLTKDQFLNEIASLIQESFDAAPEAEEVDVWATVPISVGKGVIVAGDLARPTSRTVFTLSARRDEAPAALAQRLRAGTNVYVDEEWARVAFKKS